MKKIRKNTFETNSSSTHAIVIPKNVDKDNYYIDDSLDHRYGFGREECRICDKWDEKLAYVYMALKDIKEWSEGDNQWKPRHIITQNDLIYFKNKMWSIWEDVVKFTIYNNKWIKDSDKEAEINNYLSLNNDDYHYENPQDLFNYIDKDDGYDNFVDHISSLDEGNFIDLIMKDDEFLKRLIFNEDSYITIGGDEYRGYNIKTIGFEYDYDEHYYVNKNGDKMPEEYSSKDSDRIWEEYNINAGGFWDKLKEYEKENDVFLKGN